MHLLVRHHSRNAIRLMSARDRRTETSRSQAQWTCRVEGEDTIPRHGIGLHGSSYLADADLSTCPLASGNH